MDQEQDAVLVLEDGSVFRGASYGSTGARVGILEICALMTGYQEAFSDPVNAGKILVMTAPHIGNVGVNDEDARSPKLTVAGIVVRDASRVVSNFRAQRSLDDELKADKVVGITGVDTRALTRALRFAPPTRGGIFSGAAATQSPEALLEQVRAHEAEEAVASGISFHTEAFGKTAATVAVPLSRANENTLRELGQRGLKVVVFNAEAKAQELEEAGVQAVIAPANSQEALLPTGITTPAFDLGDWDVVLGAPRERTAAFDALSDKIFTELAISGGISGQEGSN